MSRVVMYAMNDLTHDSRVLREAASLAAAGHEVTVIGTPGWHGDPAVGTTEGPTFRIIRVEVPTGGVWWTWFVRTPWQTVREALGTAWRQWRRGVDRPRAVALVLGALVSLPWVAVRAGWVAVVNHLLRRPVRLAGLEFVRRWRVETSGWGRRAGAAAPRADIHHAHDMEALPVAAAAARRDGTQYVYDSHEIFMAWGPILQQPSWLRWAMARWERRLTRGAAALITVNGPIARELGRRLGPRRTVVIHNCPPRWDPPAVPEDRLRSAAGIPAEAPVVLCHGGFQAGRGLEETAVALSQPGLERAHLVFLGYRPAVIAPILGSAALAGRVHYLPAVPPPDVTAWVAGADVDVMAILPLDQNSYLSTPNKLFESLAAGVPVVSSDLPERRRILAEDPAGPLGALCNPRDPASIAAAIGSLLDLPPPAAAELRRRCLRAAHERWNWELESAKLVGLYAELAVGA
jgi:glycosyltransferase involved in cell wall biosynthesis